MRKHKSRAWVPFRMATVHRLSYRSYLAEFRLPGLWRALGVALRLPKTAAEPIAVLLERPPEPLPDIGTRHENWTFGRRYRVLLTQQSDWEWHDLRGIYLQDWRFQLEVQGLPEAQTFRLERKSSELRMEAELVRPRSGEVLQAMAKVLEEV